MDTVSIKLGKPVTVALAPPEVREWGPYQFPGLTRLPNGAIQLSFHVEADSATAYGLPPARAVSTDEGKTWQLLPREEPGSGTAQSWGSRALHLPNGDWISVRQQRPLKVDALDLPGKPFCELKGAYGQATTVYRVEELPSACGGGWMIYRLRAGTNKRAEETPDVNLPGEVRSTVHGVMPLPWFHHLALAPDGALWGVNYTRRIVDGKYQERTPVLILRSADMGKTWNLWSEILYAPDRNADPKWDQRAGNLEPAVNFMPDGSVLCLIRTTDGNGVGPLYLSRSTDNGRTWTTPRVFDDLGVWPQMLTLKNGVTLAVYGRPGLYVRATADPSGLQWDERTAIVEPAKHGRNTCSYAALLPLADDTALVAYSQFNLKNNAGKNCKGVRIRKIAVTP